MHCPVLSMEHLTAQVYLTEDHALNIFFKHKHELLTDINFQWENQAKASQIGLWSLPNPDKPWERRKDSWTVASYELKRGKNRPWISVGLLCNLLAQSHGYAESVSHNLGLGFVAEEPLPP